MSFSFAGSEIPWNPLTTNAPNPEADRCAPYTPLSWLLYTIH